MNKNSTENINNDPVDTLSNQESSESKKDQPIGYEQSEITKTSSQTGEYLVCQGATCLCDQGEKIHLGLSVLSNKKIFINDSSAVATIDDNVLNGTFQKCKLNPASGKPCIYKPGNKWDWKSGIQAYFSEIGGKKILTENAILRCPVFPAGTISLSYNGQEIDVLESDKEDLDSSVSSSIICVMDDNVEPDQGLKNKKPSITSIAVTINDNVIKSTSSAIQKITLLQNRAYQFSVTDKNKADFNYWYIREKTEADKGLTIIPYNKDEGLVYEQKGTSAQFTFKQIGLFYIEGFGTANPKNQLYKEATFEVEVLDKNKLTGIKLTPPALEASQESIYQLQAETSYNIQLQALFPLEHEDLEGLVVEIQDTSVRFVPPGLEKLPLFKGKEALSFNLTTAKWGSYTLLVKKGEELLKKYDFPIIENEVKNIKIIKPQVGALGWVRPGTRVTFEAELSKEQSDNQRFRWKLDTTVLPDENSKTFEHYFGRIAEYKIEASYKGFFNTLPTKTASCSLTVKPNEITAITSSKSTQSLSIGSDVTFKVETPYLDLIDTEYITWELQKIISKDSMMPSNAMRYSLKPRDITHLGNHVILGGKGNIRKELSIQFNQVASYTLSVRMGTKELFDKPIEINVVKSHIEQWFFCDKEGNRMPKIGWEQEFCIRIQIKGCENRKVKIDFWYDTTSDNIDNRFYKIDTGGEIEDFDFVLKEDGLAQWNISSRKLWTSLKELVNKQGSSAKHEYARILFTVSEVDTICDNSKDYAKGHPLYGYIYPTQTDNTTAIIPNKTEYNGSFLDHNKQKLTQIISYTDIAYMSLKRINSPDDTLAKELEIRLIENRPKQDLNIQSEQIDSFDKEGCFIRPVAMNVLRLTSAGQPATQPRYFYMQLYDKAKQKIIYTVPEGYETDGEKNDCEIISLVKDDYTVEEIKNQDLSRIIESNAKLVHNLERLSDFKPAPIVTPEFDEEAFNRKRTEDINIEAQKKNKETIDKSKNYHLQLKVAQESVQQNSRYKRTGKQVGQASAGCSYDGECVCKKYNLIWGAKVDCAFRRKVVDVCKILWGEDRKIDMANGLMAVMAVETDLSFKAHVIMGIPLKANASDVVASDFDQWVEQKDKNGNIIRDSKGNPVLKRSSRAVGLIQFTQAVFEDLKLFTKGSGFDALHRVKLKFAQKGEIAQLDDVKNYLEKKKDKMLKPEDIYIYVFAPDRIDRRNPNDVLYDSKIDGDKYGQNNSIDTKDGNNDGKIQRKELLGRYYNQYSKGKLDKHRQIEACKGYLEEKLAPRPTPSGKWHDPVDRPALNLYNSESAIKPESSFLGYDRGRLHQGLDLFALPGTPIYACLDGKVVQNSLQSGGAGQYLKIQVNNTREVMAQFNPNYKCTFKEIEGVNIKESDTIFLGYMHIHPTTLVDIGDRVTAGQHIGYTSVTGFNGRLPSPHLHFMMAINKSPKEAQLINPAKYITKLYPHDTPEQREAARYLYYYTDPKDKNVVLDPKGTKVENPKNKK